VQVAFSVIVLQVFRTGKLIWLLWAVLGHALVDLVAVGLQQLLGAGVATSLIVEGVIAVFGLLAIWIIWWLRDAPPQPATAEASPPQSQFPLQLNYPRSHAQ